MRNAESNLSRFRGWAKRVAAGVIGRRTAEITVESHRVLVIRRLGSTRAWCQECGAEADMVRAEEAMALTRSSPAQLGDGVLGHGWHVTQDQDGRLWICLESILKAGF
jgi:hypothetical protein